MHFSQNQKKCFILLSLLTFFTTVWFPKVFRCYVLGWRKSYLQMPQESAPKSVYCCLGWLSFLSISHYSLVPESVSVLRPWLTEELPTDATGVSSKKCLIFLPCLTHPSFFNVAHPFKVILRYLQCDADRAHWPRMTTYQGVLLIPTFTTPNHL